MEAGFWPPSIGVPRGMSAAPEPRAKWLCREMALRAVRRRATWRTRRLAGHYYAVLGVAPSASQQEIKASGAGVAPGAGARTGGPPSVVLRLEKRKAKENRKLDS